MKLLFKLIGLALTASLAACQTTAPSQQRSPAPADPVPPAISSQNAQPAAPAASRQQQSGVVITVHLAQQRQEASLVPVDAGGDAPLYALPQPVLTQGDMARVSPVTTDGRSFLMLEMNQQGIPKLRNVTEQARGHYLLLSVGGQLVSVAQIREAIADGRLLVATQSPEHTQAIVRLMQGR